MKLYLFPQLKKEPQEVKVNRWQTNNNLPIKNLKELKRKRSNFSIDQDISSHS